MLFSSIVFIFYFLPIVLAAYYLLPKKCRNGVLLIASIFFYSWGEPVYVFLMIFSAVFNYIMSPRAIPAAPTSAEAPPPPGTGAFPESSSMNLFTVNSVSAISIISFHRFRTIL